MNQNERNAIDAAVFRRLLAHFDERRDVQNIDLMILAGFCRNCLSKWYLEAATEQGLETDLDGARERVYGMPYSQWKENFQQPATDEQLAKFAEQQGGQQRRLTANSASVPSASR